MQNEASASPLQGALAQDTPCRYFYRSGRCKRGDKCLFSHSSTRKTSLRDAADEASTPTARLSAQAPEFTSDTAPRSSLSARAPTFQPSTNTSQDDDSAWQDIPPKSHPTSSTPASDSKTKASMKGVAASISSANTAHCDICMETPPVYAQHPNCDHLFCPPCLDTWRRQHNQAKNKNCPICRTPSQFTFVTPQPFTSGARTLALERFRQRAAETPCKNFTKSLALSGKKVTRPFCVFGDECLYRHEMDGNEYKFGQGRFKVQRSKKGRGRIVGLSARGSDRTVSREFFARIQDMDERVRMFLSTRVILSARSQMSAAH